MKSESYIKWDIKAPLSDGISLSLDVYGSDESKRKSTILLRTPYGKSTDPIVSTGKFFASRGFVFISCDVRGRGDSDGEFVPYENEGRDGYDLIGWIAKQPWSNGRVATWGASYSGRIQWYTAVLQPPALKAMISVVPPSDPFVEDPTGISSPLNASWEFLVSGRALQNVKPVDWERVYMHLPLSELDVITGRRMPHWHVRLEHQNVDEYTRSISYQDKFDRVRVPVLHISGWYDDEQIGTPLNFAAMSSHKDRTVAENQYMIMGPWGHAVNTSRTLGEFDFGPNALIDLLGLEADWLDRYLNNSDTALPFKKTTRIFVMGKNEWRDFDSWPPETSTEKRLYITSSGKANSRLGDGSLLWNPPSYSERTDSFTYDPSNPVPFIADQNYAQIGGPDDYSSIERRDDILVYSTDILDRRVTMIGPVRMTLFASTSAPDTDFTAKLLVVLPDSRAIRLCDGIVRLGRQEGIKGSLNIKAGNVIPLEIDMWNTSYSFEPGQKIRVEISSSAFPKFARNLNVEDNQATTDKWQKAEQFVYHGKTRPSSLVFRSVVENGRD